MARARKEMYPVLNRYTGAVQFTAEITCKPDAHPSLKLGLAVAWGVKNHANLYGADLRSANLYGANLCGANLRSADLRSADLYGANLCGANLRSADLYGANLCGADLYGADLRSANLRSANLGSANLGSANLRSANLGSANLGSANLGSANLRSANLGSANLGTRITRLFCSIDRSDGYRFLACELKEGGVKIRAGCRWFSIFEYREHTRTYGADAAKVTETLWILNAVEQRAADLGILTEAPRKYAAGVVAPKGAVVRVREIGRPDDVR